MGNGDTSWKARSHRAQTCVNLRPDWGGSSPKTNFMWQNWLSRVFKFPTLINILSEPEELQTLLAQASAPMVLSFAHTQSQGHMATQLVESFCVIFFCKSVFHKDPLMPSTFSSEQEVRWTLFPVFLSPLSRLQKYWMMTGVWTEVHALLMGESWSSPAQHLQR